MTAIAILTAAHIETPEHLKWLAECIGSVQAQTFGDWEHILIDDGSPIHLSQRLMTLFPHVHYLRLDNSEGPGEARNLGVRSTDADYLFCLDADDTLTKDALDVLYRARCPNGYVYGDMHVFDEKAGEDKRLPDWSHDTLAMMTGPIGVTALQPRALWHRIGGWSHLDGLEDIEYWIKAAEIGVCGVRIPHVTLNYRQHENSRTKFIYRDLSVVRAIREQIKEKHRQFFARSVMPCSRCPQGQEAMASEATMTTPDGKVPLKYQGPRLASFFTPFAPSGKNYRVGGRGDWVFADPVDVAFLLQLNTAGRPDFMQTDRMQVAKPVVTVDPYEALGKLPAIPSVFDITALHISEALAKVADTETAADLRVWLAQEKARSAPRVKLVRAIETKLVIINE